MFDDLSPRIKPKLTEKVQNVNWVTLIGDTVVFTNDTNPIQVPLEIQHRLTTIAGSTNENFKLTLLSKPRLTSLYDPLIVPATSINDTRIPVATKTKYSG